MRIDLTNTFNEGMNNLNTWRNRYSKSEYPSKIVLNIFFRQYTMNSIWESQIDSSFSKFKNTETDTLIAFRQLELEYSHASRQFTIGNTLIDLMNQSKDVGGLNYKNIIPLINRGQNGDNKAIEELEFTYLHYLLRNKVTLMWAAYGRNGFSKIDAIAQVTGAVIEYNQPINYAGILQLFSQLGVAQTMQELYTPLNPSEEQLQRETEEMNKYYQIACEKFNQEEFQEAIDFFTKAINASKYVFNSSAFVNRAIARMAVNQYEEAIEDFNNPRIKRNEAKYNVTDLILNYTNLGYCYYMIGNITDAKECYQKVLSFDPNDSDAKYMLSKMH